MGRLVIPAGQTGKDTSWVVRTVDGAGRALTWSEVAAENGVEIADGGWLAENQVDPADGYGIVGELVAVPEVGPAGLSLGDAFARIGAVVAKLEEKAVFSRRDVDDVGAVVAEVGVF